MPPSGGGCDPGAVVEVLDGPVLAVVVVSAVDEVVLAGGDDVELVGGSICPGTPAWAAYTPMERHPMVAAASAKKRRRRGIRKIVVGPPISGRARFGTPRWETAAGAGTWPAPEE